MDNIYTSTDKPQEYIVKYLDKYLYWSIKNIVNKLPFSKLEQKGG